MSFSSSVCVTVVERERALEERVEGARADPTLEACCAASTVPGRLSTRSILLLVHRAVSLWLAEHCRTGLACFATCALQPKVCPSSSILCDGLERASRYACRSLSLSLTSRERGLDRLQRSSKAVSAQRADSLRLDASRTSKPPKLEPPSSARAHIAAQLSPGRPACTRICPPAR